MTVPAHSVRKSLFDEERTFTLELDALCWSGAGKSARRMPYADVRDLRLIGYASPIGESFQCTVRDRKGTKVKLRSAHYRSLNNFEDRTATYAPFVRDLARRVAANAPDAKFIAGSTALWLAWLIVGVLCVGVIALLILSLFEGLPPLGAWIIAIAICLAAMPLAWSRIRKGAAHTFDPNMPPPELLGSKPMGIR